VECFIACFELLDCCRTNPFRSSSVTRAAHVRVRGWPLPCERGQCPDFRAPSTSSAICNGRFDRTRHSAARFVSRALAFIDGTSGRRCPSRARPWWGDPDHRSARARSRRRPLERRLFCGEPLVHAPGSRDLQRAGVSTHSLCKKRAQGMRIRRPSKYRTGFARKDGVRRWGSSRQPPVPTRRIERGSLFKVTIPQFGLRADSRQATEGLQSGYLGSARDSERCRQRNRRGKQ